MSPQELPDDISRWPRDPYELLNVVPASDRREVRRAYANLIRRFKPEHFPEHFRRIRAAYDIIQVQFEQADFYRSEVQWFDETGQDVTDENPPVRSGSDHNDHDATKVLSEEADDIANGRPTAPRFNSLEVWRTAQTGNPQDAYREYVEQLKHGQPYEELYLRLYWLLRLNPHLDSQYDACHWLIAGMMTLGLRGRLLELYCLDIAENPHEGVSRQCGQLVENAAPSARLADLIAARWKAASRIEQWTIVASDLKQLRPRFKDDPLAWGRLLLTAMDLLVWADEPELQGCLQDLRSEVEHVAEEAPKLTPELDRRDMLLELVTSTEALNQLVNVPVAWRHALRLLVRNSWNESLEAVRPRLLAVLAPLVQNPIRGLEWLDALESSCRPTLHHLGQLAAALARQNGADRSNVSIPTLHQRFLDYSVLLYFGKGKLPGRWQKLIRQPRDRTGRIELLVFCLQERITAQHLMHVLATSPRPDFVDLLRPAQSSALHYLCLAHLAFWA